MTVFFNRLNNRLKAFNVLFYNYKMTVFFNLIRKVYNRAFKQ